MRVSHAEIWGKNVLGKGNNKYRKALGHKWVPGVPEIVRRPA